MGREEEMRVATLAALVFCITIPLAAQEQTGSLDGKVVDASGGVLPGVTVTIAGPTILGGSRSTATTESGSYRLTNVPVGTYRVTFELAGFSTKAYEGIRIQADTTYTLNAELVISALEETVTVSGQSPIIETAATDVGFTFTPEIMNTIPNARDPWAMVSQAPGLVTSSAVGTGVNVGGTQTGNQLLFRGHGADPRQNIYILNGANVSDTQGTGTSQFYFDVDSFDEMQIEINSHSAEVQTSGILLNIVPKSGTDTLRGSGSLYYGDDNLQWNNVDDNLRSRGVQRASNLREYFDTGFDVGGPIVRDKLWFWGAFRWQEVESFVTGTRNPDGTFPIDRTYLWYPSAKINWQPHRQHNFSAYFNMAQKKRFKRGLSALRPVETTWDQQGAPIARLFTFRDDWTPSSNLLVSFKVNYMDQGFELEAQQGVDTATTPARLDLATGIWSDAPPNELGIGKDLRSVSATANYFVDEWLGGEHDLKFGFEVARYRSFGNFNGTSAQTTYPADHRLHFFNGVPLEVILFASGAPSVTNPARSAFAQDSWEVVGRLRLNLGVRWDWQANSLNEVTAPKSMFFEPVKQEGTGNLVVWNTLAPRLGVVYDVTGKANTLLKGSYSRYYWMLFADKGARASTAGDRSSRYRWNDLNGDRRFTIDELGALLAVVDPALTPVTIDPDLTPTHTDEVTAAVVHELMPNVSISATYMYRKDKDLPWQGDFQIINAPIGINSSISPADYTPVTGTDPGPDGGLGTSDDGGPLIFYELSASKVGLSPNLISTRPGYNQEYQGVELTVQRRLVNNWQFIAALTIGVQRENYGPNSFQNPQDIPKIDGTRIADSNPYIAKVMGSYAFPHDILFSAFYQYVSGNNLTRTVNSTSAALGRRLNQGNVVVLSGRRNEESYDGLNLLDFRVSYDLPIAKPRVSLVLDAFNVLNINKITSINTLSGSAFGRVLDFIPPRILRFGAKFQF